MNRWLFFGTAMVLVFPAAARGRDRLGGGEPIDRGTNQVTFWCPSTTVNTSTPPNLFFEGSFIADGPEILLRFTGEIHTPYGDLWMDQRIDNIALVTQATYDAYKDTLHYSDGFQCGQFVPEFLFWNRVPPEDLLFLEPFDAGIPAGWDTTERAFYVGPACGCSTPSAPNNPDSITTTSSGGSLGLGRSSDPDSVAVARVTIGGLTAGEQYHLSFWWRADGDADQEGDLWVDIFGVDTWSEVTAAPLQSPSWGRGVGWGDYDGDGDPDLFYTTVSASNNRLFRNDGAGVFSNITAAIMANGDRGVSWIDIENDGDLDLFVVSATASNRLYRNEGAGIFVDATSGPLAGNAGEGWSAAWADYDRDGDLDVYLPVRVPPNPSELLRNEGNGVFVNVTPSALTIRGSSAYWVDFDNDGDSDLYTLFSGRLVRNDGGSFVTVTPAPLPSSFAADWGDMDNDGDLDVYIVPATASTRRLYRNNGNGSFTNITVPPLDDPQVPACFLWLDADLDRDLDLYVGNEDVERLFRNEGNGAFVDAAPEGALAGHSTINAAGAAADFDGDGDLDIFQTTLNTNYLLRNEHVVPGKHWLQVDLVGRESNRFGVGARVWVVVGGVRQVREITAGSGISSQAPFTASFGLGAASVVDTLIIQWPSGTYQETLAVAADQRLTMVERNVIGVPEEGAGPGILRLHANVPNPFARATRIRYVLSVASSVSLQVFDISGRRIRVLERARSKSPGEHEVAWDGTNDAGEALPSGVYFYRLVAGSVQAVRKMILLGSNPPGP